MLSRTEMDLARRDPAIPGLAVVFDPDAFVGELRGVLPEADLRTAQITYLRYKPQSYCRAAYRLDVAGTAVEADVRACRPEDLADWPAAGESSSISGPLGPGRIVLGQRAVLVTVFPNDLKLLALQPLSDLEERGRLLRELLPDHPELWSAELRCLRYRPERRYVAELRATNGKRALLKSYTRRAYLRGKRNAQAFQSRGPLRVARLLGCSDQRGLLAFEWMPGGLLFDLCLAPEINYQAVSAAGAALAALHAQQPVGLDHWTRQAEAEDLIALASEVGFIYPKLAERAEQLARRLATELGSAPAMLAPLHGDFSAKQVLVDEEQAAIIDLDWASYGDPADDLGNFIAQTERCALRGELAPSRVAWIRAALLEGYGRTSSRPVPQRLGLYTAVELFRRARFPFRTREPDSAQRTEALLERTEVLLNTLPRSPS